MNIKRITPSIRTQNIVMALLRVGIAGVVYKKLTGNVRNILLLASCVGFGVNLRRMDKNYQIKESFSGNLLSILSLKYQPLYMTSFVYLVRRIADFHAIYKAYPLLETVFLLFPAILIFAPTVGQSLGAIWLTLSPTDDQKEQRGKILSTAALTVITNIATYMLTDFVFTEMASHDLGLGRGELIFKCLLAYSCCAAIYDAMEDMIYHPKAANI